MLLIKNKKSIFNKRFILYPIILFVGLVLSFYIFIQKYPISILDSGEFELAGVTDEVEGSDSRVLDVKQDSLGVKFKYQIGVIPINYASINFIFNDSIKRLIKDYNQVRVVFETQNLSAGRVCLNTWEEGVSVLGKARTLRPNFVPLKNLKDDLTVEQVASFDDFETMHWWMADFGSNASISELPNWDEIYQFGIHRDKEIDSSKPATIFIKGVYFERNYTTFWIVSVFLEVFLIIVLLGMEIKPFQKSKVVIEYQNLEISSSGQKPWETELIEYIGTEYSNSELKIEHLTKRFGVSSKAISNLIQEKFKMNFRQYLNAIRVKESKKLLLETNLSVKEIAYSVGYNSPNNFRKAFKSIEGKSPTDLRV